MRVAHPGQILQIVPRSEPLVLIVLGVLVIVGIPTVGMYRRSGVDGRSVVAWTGLMSVASVLIPVIGPILLWLAYALTMRE